MARKGAMAKNPPLRGAARKEFRAAQREAVASGGPMPTQAQFRPRQQPQQRPQPIGGQVGQQIGQIAQDAGMQAGQQFGQMPPDKMMRFPQPGNQVGATLGAAMGMPQPSANNGGKYRLSPGVYGSQEQAMKQFNDQMMQRPEHMRYPGGSPNFNEANSGALMLPPGQQGPSMDQFFQKGQIQDGMFRSPGVPMKNIPGMEQWQASKQPAVQPGAYMPEMRRR